MNNPELYEKTNDLSRVSTKFLLDKYADWLTWQNQETILEIGVGSGNTTKEVVIPSIPSSSITEYIGVDVCKDFVLKAEMTLADNAEFTSRQMNIEADEVPSEFIGKFDHVLSFTTLHWVQEPRKAFENIYKMLKPGGEIFLAYFDKSPLDGALECLSRNPRWAKYGHEKFISPYYYDSDTTIPCEKDLIAAGMKNYRVELERMVFRFPDMKNCIDGLYSVSPIIHLIPEADLEDYKTDFVRHALRTGGYFEGDDHGNKFMAIDYNFLVVYAKK